MKKLALAALAVGALLSVAPVVAQDSSAAATNTPNGNPEFATLDADKSGGLTFAEVSSGVSLTQADFDTADKDKNGSLDLSEYASLSIAATGSIASPGTDNTSSSQ